MMSIGTPLMWLLFAAFVVIALLVDYFALNKEGAHRVSTREAAIWSTMMKISLDLGKPRSYTPNRQKQYLVEIKKNIQIFSGP